MRIKFYKKLYLGDDVDEEDVYKKIEDGTSIFNLYLVCVAKNVHHIFEIFSLSEAYKEQYNEKEYIIVGMAYGKRNAFKIVRDIFDDNKNDIKNIKQKFIKNK